MKTARTIFVTLIVLAFTLSAPARVERTSRLTGVVLDPNGARIPFATITIESAAARREAQTNDEGSFEVELPAGSYKITIEADGFQELKLAHFRVRPNTRESLKVSMKVKPPESPLKID